MLWTISKLLSCIEATLLSNYYYCKCFLSFLCTCSFLSYCVQWSFRLWKSYNKQSYSTSGECFLITLLLLLLLFLLFSFVGTVSIQSCYGMRIKDVISQRKNLLRFFCGSRNKETWNVSCIVGNSTVVKESFSFVQHHPGIQSLFAATVTHNTIRIIMANIIIIKTTGKMLIMIMVQHRISIEPQMKTHKSRKEIDAPVRNNNNNKIYPPIRNTPTHLIISRVGIEEVTMGGN